MLALNLAMCWKLCINIILLCTQSAGNLLNLNFLGILRDYTPSIINYINILNFSYEENQAFWNFRSFSYFSDFSEKTLFLASLLKKDLKKDLKKEKDGASNNYIKNIKNINSVVTQHPDLNKDKEFFFYLTGLIEGDGTIIVPKTERSIKGKLNYPSIQISFYLRDFPLALIIQQKLGFGSISRTKGSNAYRLTINNYEGLIYIVKALNGKFRTVKINDFYLLIDFLNNRFSELNIIKNELNTSSFKDNSWLSGFIDSDGHFFVRLNNSKVSCGFELVQASSDHKNRSKKKIMLSLSEYFNVNLFNINKDYCKGKLQYGVRFTNIKSNFLLIDYLSNYPLFSSKFLNYNDFNKVVNIINNKEHKTKEGLLTISEITKTMNNRRNIFIWDHLKNFYNINN